MSGYQGFKSFSVQPCPTLKPGDSYVYRANKFAAMGSHIVLAPSANRLGDARFQSVATQDGSLVQPSHYHSPKKYSCAPIAKELVSKPFIAQTIHQQDFTCLHTDLQVLSSVSIERMQTAFEEVAGGSQQHTISATQIPFVLTKAVDGQQLPSLREITRQLQTIAGPEVDISWTRFRGALDQVLQRNCLTREKGGGLSKAEIVQVIPTTTPSSSHYMDYGRYGDRPGERPYMEKGGMMSTTDDIQKGTTKQTHQIPGYCGFLPHTSHNPHAVAQADGTHLRTAAVDLRLYHSANIPGYLGHRPVDCVNYRGECRAGSDKTTTAGESYRPHN